jgi:hypothetical protein
MPLLCRTCKDYTETVAPIMIKKFNACRFCVHAVCSSCRGTKHKFLNNTESKMLPAVFQEMSNSSTAIGWITDRSGNVFDIWQLINPILNY